MPTRSPTPNRESNIEPVAASIADSDATPATSAQKSSATVRRHKHERRAESLSEIRAQTAAGTLVIRHMTVEQHDAASEVARQTRARNQARGRRYRAPGDRAPDEPEG